MRKALYRHYRPKKLAEVVGQEHITTTLENALKTGRISHAYLFTGPKGVGKTSVARILAHEINNLKYEDDQTHLDIIEIDAASNRRIDEIRELRDKIHIAPISGKYKVYIIDEVHMLTREAFNALLKTLEEPPEHAVFILATTEAHKVPETILSRTQRFSFRAVGDDDLAKYLKIIADKEKIKIDPEALRLVAEHGGGSFRDSIGLLDQLSGNKEPVTAEVVTRMVGLPTDQHIESLIEMLASADIGEIIGQLQSLRSDGVSPSQTAKTLASRLRQELLASSSAFDPAFLLDVVEALLNVPTFGDQAAALEIALLKPTLARRNERAIVEHPKAEATAVVTIIEPVLPDNDEDRPQSALAKPKGQSARSSILDGWPAVLAETKRAHNTLYGVLRMAQVSIDDGRLLLGFKFPFHAKQISQERNLSKVRELVSTSFGEPLIISVIVSDDYEEPAHAQLNDPEEADPADSTLSNISNIFGSAELLD